MLGIDLIPSRKHELQVFMLSEGRDDRTEYVCTAIQYGPHGSVNERLAGYSIPREIHPLSALAVVEWSRVMELRWPMRTFEVERFGDLGNRRPG